MSKDYKQLIEAAESYLDKGDWERGLPLLKQASELAGEAEEPIQQSAILNNLALAQERAGQGETARETLLYSLKLLRHANASNEIQVLNNLGLIERDLGNLDGAIKYYETILEILEDIDEPFERVRALTTLGLMYKDQNKLTKAIAYVQDALTLLEDDTVAALCEQREQGCRDTVLSALALLNHLKQALMWAEQSKSREFLRRLRLSDVTRPHGVPQALIDREMQLIIQLRQTAAKLQAADEPNRLNILRNYEALEKNLHQLWDEIEPLAPEYVALRKGKPVSWKELQECLEV